MTDAVSRSSSTAGTHSSKSKDLATRRDEARAAFQKAIGNTFYRQMMKSLRESTSKAAYMHGGQAEDIFQAQLDEILIERMTEANGGEFSDRLFERQFPNFRDPAKLAGSAHSVHVATDSAGDQSSLIAPLAERSIAGPSTTSAVMPDRSSDGAKLDRSSHGATLDGEHDSTPATPPDPLRRLNDELRRQGDVEQHRSTGSLTSFSFDV